MLGGTCGKYTPTAIICKESQGNICTSPFFKGFSPLSTFTIKYATVLEDVTLLPQ
jgi:hypothetical protein